VEEEEEVLVEDQEVQKQILLVAQAAQVSSYSNTLKQIQTQSILLLHQVI
jgi:hypothetical protein